MTRHEFLSKFYCYEAIGFFGDDFTKGLKIIHTYTDNVKINPTSNILASVNIKELINGDISGLDIRELHNRDWTIENKEDEEYLVKRKQI